MISHIARRWRWLRRLFSRDRWSARLVGVKSPRGEAAEPGLIMIQVDGLSRTHFERAVQDGRMPFLKQLIRRKHFTLETFYSGVLSTMPAVQAEIFYGVKAAVDADPLLGGAQAGSRDLASQEIMKPLHPFKQLLLCIAHAPKILRMITLAGIEFGVALGDAIRGSYHREKVFKELIFVPARVAVCVVLREMIRFRVLLDIERGARVIHANFLGYDEQAHRRGPGSAFAHWSLKAVDKTVRDIYRAAADSSYRDYELIIYSGHGQEKAQQAPPVTIPAENGAHDGLELEETRGFLLVPDRIRRWHLRDLPAARTRVRGEDLRKIAMHYLGRDGEREEWVSDYSADPASTLRVMTYNIHSCVGIDSKTRPERIARVINHFEPDIVGVQEVDCHRPRSGGQDQAQLIADHLRMTHVFQAMLEERKERYGIAIFSKYPFKVMRAGNLTEAGTTRLQEARGAIWVRLDLPGRGKVHFINTHFGLGRAERRRQMDALTGPGWIADIPPGEPIVLCGDFNTGPRSKLFRKLDGLYDAQRGIPGRKPQPTFSSVSPLLRLDHIFISPHFVVQAVEVPDSPTAVVASDHRPVCVELAFRH